MTSKRSLGESMTNEQICEKRRKDAERKAAARAARSAQQIIADRAKNRVAVAASRANRTPQQIDQARERNRECSAQFRADRTPQQADLDQQQNTSRMANRRLMQAEIQRQAVQSIAGNFDEQTINERYCGALNVLCEFCNSKNFHDEKPTDGKFSKCCRKGVVILPEINVAPLLQQLMTNNHAHSKNFMDNIRAFNSSLAFASMGANIAPPPGGGPYCFRIHDSIYHRVGVLNPSSGEQRKYAQLFILDPMTAADQRMHIAGNMNCNPQLMQELSHFVTTNNPFAISFKMLHEVEQECIRDAQRHGFPPPNATMAILQNRNSDLRRYNAPRVNEVAVIFQNADGEPPLDRDLLVHCRVDPTLLNSRKTERINVLDPNLDPIVYPLLFPYGDQSWGINIPLGQRPRALSTMGRYVSANPRTRVSQMEFYSYHFSIRNRFNPFLNAGKLTQQFFVDAYVKTEANRFNYIKQNQSKLRVEFYKGLHDHLNSRAEAEGLLPGVPLILPSSFKGSPRDMAQSHQDAMAIVRKYGPPDFFVTMTCNPKWKEIVENLESWQSVEHRPDLISRVFNIKLNAMLHDISANHVLGKPVAKIHVIEFQKRGLPHAHILLILKCEDKPKDIAAINNLVSAEIPDINTHPRLHAIVTKHMVHGPCGSLNPSSPCMDNGKCTKNFPKDFQEETDATFNGYPKYRRRNNGRIASVRGKEINNRWIVPIIHT